MRDFDMWLAQMRDSIANYGYYVDFAKVVANAERFRFELNLMNALVGKTDIEAHFRTMLARYPTVIEAVPILLAKRESEIYARDADGGGLYCFERFQCQHSIDDYCVFMRKTGLFDIISSHIVSNLYDYVLGVETGLDSNGRKNRGGHQMEDLVERFLINAGVEYYKEMYSSDIAARWHVNLSSLTNTGKTEKRFDFVVKTQSCVYAIETNFYGGSGSKLNETARSYKMLAIESQGISGFKFVWFTDGAGWNGAKDNLRETFEVLPTMYNIAELESGIASSVFV